MLLIAQLEQCWRGGLEPSNLVQYCLGGALFLLRPPWLPSCPLPSHQEGPLKPQSLCHPSVSHHVLPNKPGRNYLALRLWAPGRDGLGAGKAREAGRRALSLG